MRISAISSIRWDGRERQQSRVCTLAKIECYKYKLLEKKKKRKCPSKILLQYKNRIRLEKSKINERKKSIYKSIKQI